MSEVMSFDNDLGSENKKAKKESKFDNKKQSRADDKSRPEAI